MGHIDQRPDIITSSANPLLKEVRKAIARGELTEHGWCVAETLHLLEEAVRSACRIHRVIAAESVIDKVSHAIPTDAMRVTVVADKLLDASSQGVVALVDPPQWTIEHTLQPSPAFLLVLDGVQDPGNLGTILRSAEAFGATGVLMLKGVVSPFNSKAIRASSGSIFRVPFAHGVAEADGVGMLRERGIPLYAAMPASARDLTSVALASACAIVIGSEGHGVSASLRAVSAGISIPTRGVESLNAAVSAAVILYEARRQRSAQFDCVEGTRP